MLDNIEDVEVMIHFYECWDEDLYLKVCECEEWFDELKTIFDDDSIPKIVRFQRIVDSITGYDVE